MKYFKFRSCNEQNFNALEKQSIYFSPLYNLNDVFEGRYVIDEKITDRFDKKLERRLICCFSKGDEKFIHDNHYMWTHYADEHKGFCIEYNDRILNGFKQYKTADNNIQENVWMSIKYTDSYSEPIQQGDNLDIKLADLISHKNISFEHENEIRLVLHTTDPMDNMRSVKGCINAIYLGCRISVENKLKLIYLASKLNVKCYQMCLGSASYVLDKFLININYSDLRMVDPKTCQLISL